MASNLPHGPGMPTAVPSPPDPLAPQRAAVAAAEADLRASRVALLIAALEIASGNRERAAPLLGVTSRTLHRWIVELDLVDELDALARDRGWAAGQGGAARALRSRMGRRAAGRSASVA